MDIKEMNLLVDRIFEKEERGLLKEIRFKYDFGWNGGKVSDKVKLSCGYKEDLFEVEDIVLTWDTYYTLKKYYDNIPFDLKDNFVERVKLHLINSQIKLCFVYKYKVPNGIYKVLEHSKLIYKSKSSLAFYFLLRIGKVDEAVLLLNKNKVSYVDNGDFRTKWDEDPIYILLDDIQYFLHYESKYFTKDSLLLLENLSKYYRDHPLLDRIGDFFYDELKMTLDGNVEEIQYYRDVVFEKINKFSFNKKLVKFMDEIYQELYLDSTKKSDYSGLIGNLRQFFVDLRIAIAQKIEKITGDKLQSQDPGIIQDYLKKHFKLNEGDMWFMKSLVKIQHVEGGHDFFSEKKYAILVKNIVLELSYFLLESLDEFEKQNRS